MCAILLNKKSEKIDRKKSYTIRYTPISKTLRLRNNNIYNIFSFRRIVRGCKLLAFGRVRTVLGEKKKKNDKWNNNNTSLNHFLIVLLSSGPDAARWFVVTIGHLWWPWIVFVFFFFFLPTMIFFSFPEKNTKPAQPNWLGTLGSPEPRFKVNCSLFPRPRHCAHHACTSYWPFVVCYNIHNIIL